MMRAWKHRLLVAMLVAGVSFGALAHPIMAANTDPMHAEMPCCQPIVTSQDAAPSNAVAIVDALPIAIPSSLWRATIDRLVSTTRPVVHLPKIPKQLTLVGSIFKRE